MHGQPHGANQRRISWRHRRSSTCRTAACSRALILRRWVPGPDDSPSAGAAAARRLIRRRSSGGRACPPSSAAPRPTSPWSAHSLHACTKAEVRTPMSSDDAQLCPCPAARGPVASCALARRCRRARPLWSCRMSARSSRTSRSAASSVSAAGPQLPRSTRRPHRAHRPPQGWARGFFAMLQGYPMV